MSMYVETVKTGAAAVRRASKKDPMALLASLREKDQTGSFENVVRRWKQLVENDSEYCDAALIYAARNYWTSLERDERRQSTSHQSSEERNRAIAQTVQHVEQTVLLNFILSNGKRLRDCTGTECIKEGGWLAAIGKKVGRRIVGQVLSEKQVAELRKI